MPERGRGRGLRRGVIFHLIREREKEKLQERRSCTSLGQYLCKILINVICRGKGRKNLLGRARNARFNAVCGRVASAYLRELRRGVAIEPEQGISCSEMSQNRASKRRDSGCEESQLRSRIGPSCARQNCGNLSTSDGKHPLAIRRQRPRHGRGGGGSDPSEPGD